MYLLKDSMSAHAGFPHSETSGSKPTYGSPKTFAVSRVLHRLPVPRHSPCALLHLTLQVCSFELSRSLCNVFIDLNDSRFFLGIKIFSFQRTSESWYSQNWTKFLLQCASVTDGLLLAFLLSIHPFSLERRWSSRRFSYGYLVTTSPQSSALP